MSLPILKKQYYTAEDYYNIPDDVRAELIKGQIYYMAAPSRLHQDILMELAGTIRDYIRSKKGPCRVYPAPFAVLLNENEDTVLEPDISVICDHDKLTDRGCTGAPDWVIEITSPSNTRHDYIAKLYMYHAAGVREYWIVDAQNDEIHVYGMEDNSFSTKTYSFNDTVKVGIYEDLYIDFANLDIDRQTGQGW